jgi:hypothetical protein
MISPAKVWGFWAAKLTVKRVVRSDAEAMKTMMNDFI